MLKDAGRSNVHDGLLDVAWFCVCKLGGSLTVRVRWETEGFVWKLSDSRHQHALHQVDTYV